MIWHCLENNIIEVDNIKYFIKYSLSPPRNYYNKFIDYCYLGTESPIYNQILQQEQIELHKLSQLIKSHSGVILDYNTDAINCVFPDNNFPFELVEDIQLKGHYWDKSNKVYKT